MDAVAESGAAAMNGPLGDETKMNQDLTTNVMLISCETEELGEAYKILMLTGVDLRFSGLTRELQPAVWARIRQVPWQAAMQRPVLIDSLCLPEGCVLVQCWPASQGDSGLGSAHNRCQSGRRSREDAQRPQV